MIPVTDRPFARVYRGKSASEEALGPCRRDSSFTFDPAALFSGRVESNMIRMVSRIGKLSCFVFILTGCLFDSRSNPSPPEDPYFSQSVEGLEEAKVAETRVLHNGDSLDL